LSLNITIVSTGRNRWNNRTKENTGNMMGNKNGMNTWSPSSSVVSSGGNNGGDYSSSNSSGSGIRHQQARWLIGFFFFYTNRGFTWLSITIKSHMRKTVVKKDIMTSTLFKNQNRIELYFPYPGYIDYIMFMFLFMS
jgi:hypothetical protein